MHQARRVDHRDGAGGLGCSRAFVGRGEGQAYALPHARILLHQPYGDAEGQAVDIEIQAKEMVLGHALDGLAGVLGDDLDQSRTIRLPVHMSELINKLGRAQTNLRREPLPEEIGQA